MMKKFSTVATVFLAIRYMYVKSVTHYLITLLHVMYTYIFHLEPACGEGHRPMTRTRESEFCQ